MVCSESQHTLQACVERGSAKGGSTVVCSARTGISFASRSEVIWNAQGRPHYESKLRCQPWSRELGWRPFLQACVLIHFKELTGVSLISFTIHQPAGHVGWYFIKKIDSSGRKKAGRIKDIWDLWPTNSGSVISLLRNLSLYVAGVSTWATLCYPRNSTQLVSAHPGLGGKHEGRGHPLKESQNIGNLPCVLSLISFLYISFFFLSFSFFLCGLDLFLKLLGKKNRRSKKYEKTCFCEIFCELIINQVISALIDSPIQTLAFPAHP